MAVYTIRLVVLDHQKLKAIGTNSVLIFEMTPHSNRAVLGEDAEVAFFLN